MTTAEKIEVLNAFEAGETIEERNITGGDWYPADPPSWNFSLCVFRRKPSPVAAGHNPDQLTEAQVDVKGGWRLLGDGEVPLFDDEYWCDCVWHKITCYTSNLAKIQNPTIRSSRPLPPKKVRRVLSASELPPFIQICSDTTTPNKDWCTVIIRAGRYLRHGAGATLKLGLAPEVYENMAWRGVDGVEHAFVVEEEAS
jgi:hypothetical protein